MVIVMVAAIKDLSSSHICFVLTTESVSHLIRPITRP